MEKYMLEEKKEVQWLMWHEARVRKERKIWREKL
jgi:hypothetical protein